MAQKALDIAVRELQKAVTTLSDKVTSLESKISDQMTIISTQTQVINHLKSAVEGRHETKQQLSGPTTPCDKPPAAEIALQRPVRQARLRATAALTTTSNYAGATKKPASIAEKPQASPTNEQPTTPEVTRQEPKATSNVSNVTVLTSAYCRATKLATSTIPNGRKNEPAALGSQSEWKTVSHKRTPKRRTVIAGIGKIDAELQTVEKLKYIQVWSFRPETTTKDILKYLNKIIPNDEYEVEKRQIQCDRFSSFVIGMPESLHERVSAPTSWPQGVRISEWFLTKPRQQWRGKNNTDAGSCAAVASSRQ